MTMTLSKPSIVLVHGAFHTPAHFNLLFRELRKAGYVVTVPALPSTHERPAVKSQEPDRQAVRDAIDLELDLGNDVVVLAHSYGGIPTANALEGRAKSVRQEQGLSNGVIAVVFLSAFLIDVGLSMAKLSPERTEALRKDIVDEFYTRTEDQARSAFYGEQTKEVQDRAVSMLRPWSWNVLFQDTDFTPWANKEIPLTYILCEKDNAIPPAMQEAMATAAGVEEIIRTSSDHSPMLDKPAWVAKVVRRAAGEISLKL